MKRLNKKRLLLLGGGLWKESLADYAKAQGITLVATGNSSSSGIFQIADETYMVDSTDESAMKKLIKEHNIDGVYMGGSEPVISVASRYLNELGMPCYCTKEQWEFLENKANFKDLCNSFGLPTVPKFVVTEQQLEDSTAEVDFPVITKPADGCGSNGFSVCQSIDELKKGYAIAKDASPSGSVLVEKFVNNTSVVVFYTFANGEMHFSGLEDKFTVRYEEQGRYVAGAHIFESDLTDEFRSNFDEKLKKMFAHIGICEGSLWIEVFHSDDQYYFNEVGYRYSGSVSIYPVDYFYGINQVAMDINYALTKNAEFIPQNEQIHLIRDGVDRKSKYCIYSLHIKPGVITDVTGIDELSNDARVVAIPVTKSVGQVVSSSGTVSQVYAFVHFVFDTIDELKKMIDDIHETVKIVDENRDNMLVRFINCEDIRERMIQNKSGGGVLTPSNALTILFNTRRMAA